MRFIFVRHPQTIANEIGYIYGKKDYPYTDLGQQQYKLAIEKSEEFPCKHLVSSPLGRARCLGEGIAKRNHMVLSVDSALEEMHYGILEGLTLEEGKDQYPDVMEAFLKGDDGYTIPEGEEVEAFYHRIHTFLVTWLERNEDVLVVSHGGVIRTAIEYLLTTEPGFSWQLEIGNASFVEIVCEEGYHRLKTLANLEVG